MHSDPFAGLMEALDYHALRTSCLAVASRHFGPSGAHLGVDAVVITIEQAEHGISIRVTDIGLEGREVSEITL